jgi:uncharacterized repeat protein (TIGR01451 family)
MVYAPSEAEARALCGLPEPSVEITKSVSDSSVPLGETAKFTLTVTNPGEEVQNIEVIDALPEGLTIPPDGLTIPDGSTATLNENGEIAWSISSLETDASAELQITASAGGALLGQEIVILLWCQKVNRLALLG